MPENVVDAEMFTLAIGEKVPRSRSVGAEDEDGYDHDVDDDAINKSRPVPTTFSSSTFQQTTFGALCSLFVWKVL